MAAASCDSRCIMAQASATTSDSGADEPRIFLAASRASLAASLVESEMCRDFASALSFNALASILDMLTLLLVGRGGVNDGSV